MTKHLIRIEHKGLTLDLNYNSPLELKSQIIDELIDRLILGVDTANDLVKPDIELIKGE